MHRLASLLILLPAAALAQPAAPATPPVEPAPAVAGAPPAPAPPPSAPGPPAPSAPGPSGHDDEAVASYEPSTVSFGGYFQPQYRLRQDSPAQFDQDGFRFARARVIGSGQTRAGNLELSAVFEAEMQPTFALADGYVSVARALPHEGRISLDAGQMRVPISRQNLLSDSRLSFVDKAQLASIAPDRDLGTRLAFALPGAPVRVIAGVFDGEGKNQVENINQSFLYAGRIEVSPIGRDVPLAESAFGGHYVTAALSAGRNRLTPGDFREFVTYLGGDVAVSFKGLSGAFEYLQVKHEFRGAPSAMLSSDYKANGFAAQLAYLLPVKLPPLREARLELGMRVEEIDRNDTIPIPAVGDPAQSVREITGVVSYYLRMHTMKAQLAASHFTELEDKTAIGGDAAYNNDQLLLQVTYRLE